MNNDLREDKWNNSYKNKDNFIFYPHEEIVRFISKYIRKRIGLNDFIDQQEYTDTPKVLDFGCGIGRHILLSNEFNLEAYGFDLSKEAISVAKNNFEKKNLLNLIDRVQVADITNLPYTDKFFDFMLSHGVLDSMPFEIAKKGIFELSRTIKDSGLIYFDVISTKDTSSENKLEQEVETKHEEGTIQSYFDEERIELLLKDHFQIIELYEIKREDIINKNLVSRYHVIAKKI